jgi:hypothetical protein
MGKASLSSAHATSQDAPPTPLSASLQRSGSQRQKGQVDSSSNSQWSCDGQIVVMHSLDPKWTPEVSPLPITIPALHQVNDKGEQMHGMQVSGAGTKPEGQRRSRLELVPAMRRLMDPQASQQGIPMWVHLSAAGATQFNTAPLYYMQQLKVLQLSSVCALTVVHGGPGLHRVALPKVGIGTRLPEGLLASFCLSVCLA